MDSLRWREEFADWLEGFPWQWFCSLTFRPGLSPAQARWRLRKWVGALRDALGTADFGWFAIPEVGKTKMDFHFHVLVMGLSKWHAPERLDFMRLWWKLAGDGRIYIFKPNIGGIPYILKSLGPDDLDSVEFELSARAQMQTKFGAK